MSDQPEKVEENNVPVFVVGEGDCHVGLHPEAPDMILLAFVKQGLCLGFPISLAKSLHDGLCLAIGILEGEEETIEGAAKRPRMDN
jgi:hypothetical protein